MIKLLKTSDAAFLGHFSSMCKRGAVQSDNVETAVKQILNDVRINGDDALVSQCKRFDAWEPHSASQLLVSRDELKKAYDSLDQGLKAALHMAYDRIWAYHEKLKPTSWIDFEPNGAVLGQKVTPVDRAGLYIPGGKAAYPSSLLMNAIPALVAGVKQIVVCTPTPGGEPNALLLAAAHLCQLETIFKIGGAGAIAAMAYGTATIPKVDVITGPGNIFVATAKKLVFGEVNIDMVAGPSEIGILADDSANAKHIALDLLSQAEHDELAASYLFTPSEKLATAVQNEIEIAIKTLPRESISKASIDNNGAIVVTASMQEAIDLMNEIAPEHLEVATANPFEILPLIKHAGAIFLGHYTPEAIGDYVAGPNHTLPTGGSAKFFSPLSTEHFMKKSSIISMSKKAINEIGKECALMADTEGLYAHKASVEIRLD